jgi:hypothetical protein
MTIDALILLSALSPVYIAGLDQDTMQRRNQIEVVVAARVEDSNDILHYTYTLTNGPTAQQAIWKFWLITSHNISLQRHRPPSGWRASSGIRDNRLIISWGSPEDFDIAPNSSLTGFTFESAAIPGFVTYYTEGYAPPPSFPEGMAPDSIPGYDDLTPYGPGVMGTTVGPVLPPETFAPLAFLDTLLSYTTQSLTLGWITDESTATKYLGYFASAQSSLQADNITAARTALQQVLNNVNTDSSSTLSSEAYALLLYNTEYLLSQLPEQESAISSYSLFALHSMHLEQNAKVFSGDVGVNEAGSPPFLDSQLELSVGIGVTISPGYAVRAHRIKVKSGATVNGDVYYNTLDNNGTITGTQHTPLSLPLITTLPEFQSAAPGTQNFDIPQNGALTLGPGAYGDVMVRRNATVTFTGGIYHLQSLTTGDNVQFLLQAPSEVRIGGKFDTGQGSYVGAQDTTTLTADQIIFYVAGINGTNGNLGATPKAAKIGIGNTVKASFFVPNGTLWIRQNSEAQGQFIGKDVDVGIGVKVNR